MTSFNYFSLFTNWSLHKQLHAHNRALKGYDWRCNGKEVPTATTRILDPHSRLSWSSTLPRTEASGTESLRYLPLAWLEGSLPSVVHRLPGSQELSRLLSLRSPRPELRPETRLLQSSLPPPRVELKRCLCFETLWYLSLGVSKAVIGCGYANKVKRWDQSELPAAIFAPAWACLLLLISKWVLLAPTQIHGHCLLCQLRQEIL